MKILHICSSYFSSDIYKNLISELSHGDIENIVYVPKYYLPNDNNLNVLSAPKRYNLFDRILFYRKQKIGYDDICDRIDLSKISIIHSHNLFSGGYIAYKLHTNFGIPYIIALRNTDLNVFFKYMIHLRRLGVRIMDSAYKVIFISNSYKKLVINKYIPEDIKEDIQKKSIVIPNGIDDYFLTNLNDKSSFVWDATSINLICISTLNRNKNIDTTIKVGQYLQTLDYNVKLTLVGNIQDMKYKEIEQKHDFIKYYPPCPKENILRHLRKADIMVMPSRTETFGLVYAEAMSQGLPLIYTKGQGFDGFFENGEIGYSVNPNNWKEIGDNIIKIYNNYSSFSSNCIERVKVFNWTDIAKKYKQLYLKIDISVKTTHFG